MDNCYICLEKTSIYYKLLNCNCSIYCHEECFRKILKLDKCIICKKNITPFSLNIGTLCYLVFSSYLFIKSFACINKYLK
jgi:hypothetical protein